LYQTKNNINKEEKILLSEEERQFLHKIRRLNKSNRIKLKKYIFSLPNKTNE